jgi:undecaprenyl-diphosphatase
MIEDLLKAAVLGTVQGLTEFLPISSTGHLILFEELLGVDQDKYGLTFDAALHLGTLLALLWFFGHRWVDLAVGALMAVRRRSLADPTGRLAWLVVLGTVPAAVLGFAFEDQIEDAFREPALVGVMLIAFSGVFVFAEAVSKRQRSTADLGWFDALFIGFAQAVALVPGVSRSGATISAGLIRDMDRREAAVFAFLLSAPVIAGAALSEMVEAGNDVVDGTLGGADVAFFAVGFAFAAVVGYLSIRFLLSFLATNSLMPFVYYRVALGLLVLALVPTSVL